jgi:peptide/nickel transport system substrate-binding protein
MSFSSKDLTRRMKKVEGATVKHARRFVFKRWHSIREVRQRIALWALIIGVLIGATGLQFWWYQNEYRTTAYATGGTYAEAVLGPVNTLNPIFAQSGAEEAAGELLFSRLLNYDDTGALGYDLADGMTISQDQLQYTFTIRPDAQWSDGRYVRARDVVFTVNLLKDPTTRTTLTGWSNIKAEAVDDTSVKFTLPAVYAAFPHALRFLPILPEHVLRDIRPAQLRENSFSSAPVGSGPFALRLLQNVDSATGRKIVHLTANNSYYRGAPKLDRIQLHVYNDTDAILRALATSEVNAASDLPVTTAARVNTQRYQVDNDPVNSGVYAILNTASAKLSDVKVRRALQLATDTAAVRAAVSKSLPALDLPFVQDQLTGNVPKAPARNTQQATALLEEAGWVLRGSTRMKDDQALTLNVVTTKNPDFEKALEVLTQQWQELGITVTTNIVDPRDPAQNVAQEVLQQRRFDVLLYQLTIGADPDVYAYWHSSQASSGFNFSNYKNPIGDDALSSARARLEPDLRNAKYITFANQWLSDVPAIGLYQSTAQYVHTNSVHAVPREANLNSAIDRYNSVRYWTVGERSVFTTP